MKSKKYKRNIPITEAFQELMEIIHSSDSEKAVEYRKKLLGQSVIEYAPEAYWEIAQLRGLEIPLHVWNTFDIHTRAKYKAQMYLYNMSEIIKQHNDLQDQAIKNALSKPPPAKKKHG